MARANRHYISGQVWHITHRCHKKEFLLKFARDRRRWYRWLFEAKKRFGLRVLNYVVTSNHVHLLVIDNEPETIPKSLQLIAGRTGQEFNQRKDRKGAFWEDRYHATAVEANEHLIRCLVYIDLNMVRAGVAKHPVEWEMNGYNEIQNPPDRYGVIDRQTLQQLCGYSDYDQFVGEHSQWVSDAIEGGRLQRERCWTESIAVGSQNFIEETKTRLGIKAKGRRVEGHPEELCVLREESVPYNAVFAPENDALRVENAFFWDDSLLVLDS
jgi:REP element-mobilizing transposase RayT